PLPALRRTIIRFLLGRVGFRKGAGVMQVSYVPHRLEGAYGIPIFVAMRFTATAILGVGGVRPEPVAVDGQVEVRQVIWVSCAINHRVWDGLCLARFLTEFAKILESVDPEL